MLTALRSRVRAWLAIEIPPHSYALLRIVLGVVGLASVLGLTPVGLYWPLDGLAPLPGDGIGIRSWLAQHGLGTAAGTALFAWLLGAFTAMTLGLRSDLAVFLCFAGLVVQAHWNTLPLSSAHQVMTVLVFCLLWAETGSVWSLDARWRRVAPRASQPAWPLWLMRCQIAIVYLSSGLHKLGSPAWRDGTAVHWALNLNAFHRFPWPLPPQLAPFEVLLTWGTLLFELAFWLLILFRRTRPFALAAGVALHAGLFLALELGPFSLLMIASYACYLDPERTARLFDAARWRPI
jgi:hypothetical protein